jgi:hypothetical protein
MRKVYGISLTLSSYERGLWFDSDRSGYQPRGWGIKLAIAMGKWLSPQPKFWKKGFWQGDPDYNPWSGSQRWFVLRFPFLIAPFISVALGPLGFYLGWKDYGANLRDHPHYAAWMKPAELQEEESVYLTETTSLRKTRW